MRISRSEVEHIADLARLDLSGGEIEQLQKDLSQILEYVEKLNELDTTDVAPTAHVLVQDDVLREDVPRPSWPTEELLANAPETEEGYFRVHAVLPRWER